MQIDDTNALLGNSQRSKLLVQPPRQFCCVSPHSNHRRSTRALQARRRQSTRADQAFHLAGTADSIAVFVMRMRRRVVQLVLQIIRRWTNAHKEQAAFQTADDDCALAKLDSNSDRPDGMSGPGPRRIGRVALAAVLVEIVVVVAAVGAPGGADDGIGRARSGQG